MRLKIIGDSLSDIFASSIIASAAAAGGLSVVDISTVALLIIQLVS